MRHRRQVLDDGLYKQSEQPKNADPKIVSADMLKKKDEVIYFCHPIMSKVKPRVDTTQAPTPAKEEKKEEQQAKTADAEADKNDGPGEMDVD